MKNTKKILILTMMSLLLVSCSQKQVSENPQANDNETVVNESEYVEQICRIYSFDREKLQTTYSDKKVKLIEKDLPYILLNTLRYSAPDYTILLEDDVYVKDIELDKEKSILKINFNKDFIKDFPLGTSTESGFMDSIVKTYGYNYKVDYVSISFDGNLYTGLKGELDNDAFKVNLEDETVVEAESKNVDVKIFLYDAANDNFPYINKTIEVMDNSTITPALNNVIKDVSLENDYFEFEDNLNINTVEVDTAKDLVRVNLDSSYYELLNKMGSGTESGLLKALAYTYAYNLNVSNVEILVDNKPYEGSHILHEKDEYIKVNIDELK